MRSSRRCLPSFERAEQLGAGLPAALGAKLVTVFGGNAARGCPRHLASIVLLDPEHRRAARAAGRPLHHRGADGGGVRGVVAPAGAQNGGSRWRSSDPACRRGVTCEALSRVHTLRQVTVWSPNKERRDRFVAEVAPPDAAYKVAAVDHAGEAVVGADIIVLVTSSPTPVLENGWVKPGAHVISVGATRPTQREMDPALVARARLFVDSRAAALVESGDIVLGIQEGRFGAGSRRRRARRAARRQAPPAVAATPT